MYRGEICQGKIGIRTAPQNALCGVRPARSMLNSFYFEYFNNVSMSL